MFITIPTIFWFFFEKVSIWLYFEALFGHWSNLKKKHVRAYLWLFEPSWPFLSGRERYLRHGELSGSGRDTCVSGGDTCVSGRDTCVWERHMCLGKIDETLKKWKIGKVKKWKNWKKTKFQNLPTIYFIRKNLWLRKMETRKIIKMKTLQNSENGKNGKFEKKTKKLNPKISQRNIS